MPELAAELKSDERASAPNVSGNPRNDPSASGCSRPSRSTYAVRGVSVEIETIGDAELAAERDRGRLLHEHRVGAAVDRPSRRSARCVITPPARDAGFEDADRRRRAAAARTPAARPGDAAADDRDVNRRPCDILSDGATRRVDVLREHLHVLDRRGRQDAVPEIEDVTRPAADAREDVVGLLEHPRRRAEQQRRIEIALDAAVGADARPRLVDRDAPVGADDVAARLAQLFEDRRRAGAEVNRRDARADRRRRCVCVWGSANSR